MLGIGACKHGLGGRSNPEKIPWDVSSDSPVKAGEQPCSQVPSVVPVVAGAALRGTVWSVLAMSKIGLAGTVMGVCRRVSLCVSSLCQFTNTIPPCLSVGKRPSETLLREIDSA